ncbi:FkbM family methyltransferase [Haliscomenobacter hydrossis]|uniref:Methyltransferase FkbM family n=1 Tax=Haliscomenobacter hydrossis (strain ATCC 27775 / DSM 1100 / LMG 10767 / O) TaxID=760192 RepID=F4L437_HALH1|nr:FkbM family methyltransferase [Haliscomenobacter hydrossis]AEE50735.1 methyltransferase FkbM family [Haliscomenobacter hydrossis DSM 1100]
MSILNKIIPASLKLKLKRKLGVPNMFWSLQNMQQNGFRPNKIIDIGAYEGKWTLEMLSIFPNAKYLMIEPLESKKGLLTTLQKSRPDQITFVNALLGATDGQPVTFNEMETASSVLKEHHSTSAQLVSKTLSSLSAIAQQKGFEKPDFIKLDTQGYELEILKGGSDVLSTTQAVLMEVSLLDIHRQVPLINEVFDFMAKYGFVAYDICSLVRRPLDKALWQVDVIFVKLDHSIRNDKRWGA